MGILKLTSATEQKVQQIEHLMNELGIRLTIENHNLVVLEGGNSFPMVDTEQSGNVLTFPRTFDSERLRVRE